MKRRKIWYGVLLIGCVAMVAGLLLIVFVYNGIILPNGHASKQHEVRGVDVSSYQGKIDWQLLSEQNIQFAFIKATEGSSHVDSYFERNYAEAQKTGLRIGAYHFFSYDSSGKTQAENFVTTVPRLENALPPVVDVEFYGDKEKNLPDVQAVHDELTVILEALELHYGVRPILYATEKSYKFFLAENFTEYDIWIRNVLTRPKLSDGRDWTFWQYTNRERLEGYEGDEQYIDMNVFCGTQDDFDNYPLSATLLPPEGESTGKMEGTPPIELPILKSGKDLATGFLQDDSTLPQVVEVPLNDQSVEFTQSNALDIKVSYLMRRMAEAGVVLSQDAAEKLCIPINGEALAYYGRYTWVKYGRFDILVFKIPTGEGKADAFYVFEDSVYKGYVDHQGAIDPESCIVSHGDDVWFTATRFFGGPTQGHSGTNTFWYRLTSDGLDCELQYTSEFRRGHYSEWVDYSEKVVSADQDGASRWTVTTGWSESLSDDWQEGKTFQFWEEGSNSYELTPISPDNWLQYETAHSYSYLLAKHYDDIMALIASGTVDQKRAIYYMVFYDMERGSAEISNNLPELYQWYEHYQAEESK